MEFLPSLLLLVAFVVWFLTSYSFPAIKKFRQSFLMLVVLLMCWNCYTALRSLNASRDARLVSQQIVSIREAIEKLPPGVDRPAEFMRRLKTVDAGAAPSVVKRALSEYISAMDQATIALTNRQDTPALEQACAQKAKALTEAIKQSR
jgi:hypothetical protein